MNLEEEILREHSRRQAEKIASWVGNDRRRFGQLMELFLKGEYRITQRSAWVVSICADRHPGLIGPYLRKMLAKTREAGVHDAVPRNVIRILQCAEIPRSLMGAVATLCFDFLSSAAAPVAVKVSSMTVIARIARTEPDLGKELRVVVEQQLPYSGAGFRSRAGKVMKMLERPA